MSLDCNFTGCVGQSELVVSSVYLHLRTFLGSGMLKLIFNDMFWLQVSVGMTSPSCVAFKKPCLGLGLLGFSSVCLEIVQYNKPEVNERLLC